MAASYEPRHLVAYTDAIQQTDNDPMMDNLPWEVRDKVKSFQVNPQFREDIEALQIPQFFLKVDLSLFTDGSFELLDKEMLAEGFTLKGKAYVFQGKSPHSDYQKRGLDQGTKAAVKAAQHSKTSNIAPFEQSLHRIPRKGWSFQGLSDHGFSLVFYGTPGVYENRG